MPFGLAFASCMSSSTPRASSNPRYQSVALRTLSTSQSAASRQYEPVSPSYYNPAKEKERSFTGRQSPYLPLRLGSPSTLSIDTSDDYLRPGRYNSDSVERIPSPVQLCFGAPGSPGHLSPVLRPEVSLVEACGSTRRPVGPGVYVVKGEAGSQQRFWMVGDKMANVAVKGKDVGSSKKPGVRKFHHGRSESII
ncbi:hypothetical protein F5Y16DRAFT_383677 [Xylariaceae sp. FL0255]|nr:hypothetical protein F5Y16DRAFT_383677 [Xylariaceae sp. FL0255]